MDYGAREIEPLPVDPDLLAKTDPALLTLEAREKTQRVRDMTAAELDELQF